MVNFCKHHDCGVEIFLCHGRVSLYVIKMHVDLQKNLCHSLV